MQQDASAPSGGFDFLILGSLSVRLGGLEVALPGPRPQALLALLLLHTGRKVPTDRLAEELWSGRPPATARSALQMHITALRRALGPGAPIRTQAGGYSLAIGPDQLDAGRFEAAALHGRRELRAGRCASAATELAAALAMWRGPVLADVVDAPFVRSEAKRLDELRVTALEDRLEADLGCGEHAPLIAELTQLVAEHPYRERLRGLLMVALYRAGRQADALAAYRATRDVLVGELGIEPGPDLRELERAILAQDAALAAPVAPAAPEAPTSRVAQVSAPRSVLPVPPTPTIGRASDLARLRTLVECDDTKLVTVVGPAGVGKTRLVVELARAMDRDAGHRIHFVSLAALAMHEHVASTITRSFGLAPAPGQSAEDLLVRHLADRCMVLVLDNFEHVLDAAPLVGEILAGASGLTVVTTSREPLHVRAERVFALEPLAVPRARTAAEDLADGVAPALELFAGVARARRPDFELSPADIPVAAEICRRLDGLPLAIELAAGSLGALSLSGLAERMSAGLDALSPGPRDAPARQRTLRAALQWSHDLLDAREQRALARLSVFAGGFTLEAAEAVADVPVDVLETLVAKHLVTIVRPGRDMRFGMLETIREFGVERRLELPDGDAALRRRHLEHFVTFAERRAPELRRSWSTGIAAEIEAELDNLRAAHGAAVALAEPELALRLAVGVADYWRLRQDAEGVRWFADALEVPRDRADPRIVALALAEYAYNDGHPDWAEAESAARAALEIYEDIGDRRGRCRSLAALAVVTSLQGRADEAFASAMQAVQLAREMDEPVLLAHALAFATGAAPTLRKAVHLGEEAIAHFGLWDNWRCITVIHHNIAYRAIALGEYQEATIHVTAARRHVNVSEDDSWLAYVHGNEGLIALFTDDIAGAAAAFGDELTMAAALTMDPLVREALTGIAAVNAVAQRDALAATLVGATGSVHVGFHAPEIESRLQERCFSGSRERLGVRIWDEAVEHGRRLPMPRAVELARDSLLDSHPPG